MKNFALAGILGSSLFFANSCAQDHPVNSDNQYTLIKLYDLPDELQENSGIIVYDSLIWTFNDSGNDPVLYGVGTQTGAIKIKIQVSNAQNIDWEDIAQNDSSIFIGDFGNNEGSRQDLKIYILNKSSINNNSEQDLQAGILGFSYDNQTDYTPASYASAFDCEAMVSTNDSVYLFTKDWLTLTTHIYSLPVTPGNYTAKHIDDFDSEGLITGADIGSDHQLVLCGYNLFSPFILNFEIFGDYTRGIRKTNMDELSGVQVEGVAVDSNNAYYISNENSTIPQALYLIEF